MKSFLSIVFSVIVLLLSSCGSDKDMTNDNVSEQNSALTAIEKNTKEGVIGIFELPEMLTLSRLDSSDVKDMAFILAKDYSVLENEAIAIGAEIDGAPGVINYNNDPKNFKFECLLPIKKMPSKQPSQCKIVALESDRMLIYNHYGPYDKLLDAYNNIRVYCSNNKLKQTGPMREFYISDVTKEPNPAKWLTRVMVPVER